MTEDEKIIEYGTYTLNREPDSVIIDLENWPLGKGFKDLQIHINGQKFTFTKGQIQSLLIYMKSGGYCS